MPNLRYYVIRLVLGGGLSLVCAGVVLGLAASLGLTRVMGILPLRRETDRRENASSISS
jgi:hypothetical protein